MIFMDFKTFAIFWLAILFFHYLFFDFVGEQIKRKVFSRTRCRRHGVWRAGRPVSRHDFFAGPPGRVAT